MHMLQLGTFKVDCTPPAGGKIGFGIDNTTATGVRDPLWLRGFVLAANDTRYVVASLDYTGLMNSAHDLLVGALARAVEIAPHQVVLHCVHQHDAPLIDFELDAILHVETHPRAWWRSVTGRCAEAARTCLANMHSVAAVGHSETRLNGYASNRRILGPDGKVKGMRWSRCEEEELRRAPVGTIDPMLRSVAFRDSAANLLGSMTFYATHPQVASGRRLYSGDAPGEAMRLLAEHPAGLHAFFTGAGGNVTAGKYSSVHDLESNLLTFGKRLADGIGRNLDSMIWEPVDPVNWRVSSFPFPAKPLNKDALRAACAGERFTSVDKLTAAALLTCIEYPGNLNYTLTLLTLGNSRVLFLPGEPFVEYQLFAQSAIPDQFLAVAGNCGDSFLYLPLARHFEEGGYEPTSFCWCTDEFERRFKEEVTALLS